MANNLRFLTAGTNRFIVETVDLDATVGLFEAMSKSPVKGIVEAVPGARTVLVTYDPMLTDAGSLYDQIATLRSNTFRDKAGTLIEIPVVYDGEDLLFVADYLGWTVEELIRRHTQATYTVAFTGFAPGFAYMTCDDPEMNVPRRESPRVRIPAGAVALAGRFGGVYPSDTPGGWQLLGQTTIPMWDLSRDPAALLKPGDQVRFKQLTADRTAETHEKLPAAKSSFSASKGLKVQSSDRPALYQDAGRPGNAHQGVSQSGAADLQALREANLSVGNSPATPAIEVTYGGFSMLAEVPVTLAVAGAPAPLTISTKDGRVLYPPMDMPIALDAGDLLSLGIPKAGVRSYVALRGGYEIDQALGSSSTDTLARIGPAPIQVGDLILPAGKRCASVRGAPTTQNSLPTGADVVVLDVIMGPRADWFTEEALRVFSSQEWTVTAESSRVGARLQGPVALQRSNKDELPSEGTSRGSVQVPPSGKPVLFLADHPLTGGYPVIAVVAEYHLSLAAQVPIGARIRFNAVAAFDPQVKEFER